jgi:hypothetical protein
MERTRRGITLIHRLIEEMVLENESAALPLEASPLGVPALDAVVAEEVLA